MATQRVGQRALLGSRSCSSKSNFVRALIAADTASGGRIAPSRAVTLRFPPEPSGYAHIGHARAACLNFGLAQEIGATGRAAACNLRFDDSNPDSSKAEYVASIERDIRWLGFEWAPPSRFASDYFDRLWACAEHLTRSGAAYVCDLSAEEWRDHRGTTLAPGRPSPHRNRSVEDNLRLLREMREGLHPDGAHVLRAKIDGAATEEEGEAPMAPMSSSNIHMRDPALYRIRHAAHHRTGDAWCVYPMYDFAHCLSDAFEGITHSLCTLEFQEHRPLYDWILHRLAADAAGSALLDASGTMAPSERSDDLVDLGALPVQTEFSRLNLSHTVTSKRFLRALIEAGAVEAWDDPRLPTLAGLRRRGIPPAAIRRFCASIGLSRADDAIVDVAMLEACAREELDESAPRAMCVLRPLRVVIETMGEESSSAAAVAKEAEGKDDEAEPQWLTLARFPKDEARGTRRVPMTREIYIDQSDFREDEPPPPSPEEWAKLSKKQQKRQRGFNRLTPHQSVRLRGSYVIECTDVVRNERGDVVELRCVHDAASLGKSVDTSPQPGVVHWVSAQRSIPTEVHLYQNLFDGALSLCSASTLSFSHSHTSS